LLRDVARVLVPYFTRYLRELMHARKSLTKYNIPFSVTNVYELHKIFIIYRCQADNLRLKYPYEKEIYITIINYSSGGNYSRLFIGPYALG
jgi:hypothetical protein